MISIDRTEGITVHLTRGCECLIDECDNDLTSFNWYAELKKEHHYAVRKSNRKQIRMHRVIASRIIGRVLGNGEVVDHINGDTSDNRRYNLRVCSCAENIRNSKRPNNNTSGYKGVTKKRHHWQAQIRLDGQSRYLGIFNTPQEAHEAYKEAARQHYGQFARFE